MNRFQLTAGRSLGLAVFLLAVFVLAGVWLRNEKREPPESDTDARIAFYSARAAGRGTYPAYARLGAAYLQKARETGHARFYPLAEENLKKSEEFQTNFEAIRSLAALSLDLHRFDDALRYAQQATATMPGDLESRGLLFDAQLAVGRMKDAETTLEKLKTAIREGSNVTTAMFAFLVRQANLQELRGDLAGALESVDLACGNAEIFKLSRQSQAWCQVRLGSLRLLANCDPRRAELAYEGASKVFPKYFLAREHLAELLAAQDKNDVAARLYRQLIEESRNPSHRLALADVLDAHKQESAAAAQRTAALNELRDLQRSGNRQHLLELAFLLLDTPEPSGVPERAHRREGLKIAEQEVAIRRDLFALDALAWAQFRNGDTKAAAATMEEALREGTKNSRVLLHAVEIFLAAGQRDRAAQLLSEVERCPVALTPGEPASAKQLKARL